MGEVKKLGFKDRHTTGDLIASDTTPGKLESKKIVLSNDAYALGEMLELLVNTTRR